LPKVGQGEPDPAYRRHVVWPFCETVDDIKSRLHMQLAATVYRLLGLAPLLRKLLLDDFPLVHQANRVHGLPIRFRAHPIREDHELPPQPLMPPGAEYYGTFHSDFVDPALGYEGPDWPVHTLPLDRWFKHVSAPVLGERVTVRQMILQAANVEGGVHAGCPTTAIEKAVMDVGVGLADSPTEALPYHTLRGIAGVTVRGLDQLYDACRAE
jgi:hypothetical protein